MIDIVGYVGAACLALCAAPQAIKSFKDKRTVGISIWFLLLWYVGEILTLIYIVSTTMQIPLVINYIFNIVCITIIIFYWKKEQISRGKKGR